MTLHALYVAARAHARAGSHTAPGGSRRISPEQFISPQACPRPPTMPAKPPSARTVTSPSIEFRSNTVPGGL